MDFAFEVIIVSDYSKDGTNGFVERFSKGKIKDIRLVQTKKQSGRSIARNLGVLAAKTSLIMFCDDDVLLSKDCIRSHFQIHQNEARILVRNGILNLPWFVSVDDPAHVKSENIPLGLKNRIIRMLEHPLLIEGVKSYGRRTKFEADLSILLESRAAHEYGRWPAATGGCLSISKSFFDEVGGFDPNMGLVWGAEDLEFGLRVEQKEGRILHLRDHPVFHVDHSKSNRESDHREALNYFERKHRGIGNRLQSYFEGNLDIREI